METPAPLLWAEPRRYALLSSPCWERGASLAEGDGGWRGMRYWSMAGLDGRPSSLSAQGFQAQELPAPPCSAWPPSPERERKKQGVRMTLYPTPGPPVSFTLSRRTGRAHGQRPCDGGMEFERGRRLGGLRLRLRPWDEGGAHPVRDEAAALPARRRRSGQARTRLPSGSFRITIFAERYGLPILAPCTNRHPGKTGALRTTSPTFRAAPVRRRSRAGSRRPVSRRARRPSRPWLRRPAARRSPGGAWRRTGGRRVRPGPTARARRR